VVERHLGREAEVQHGLLAFGGRRKPVSVAHLAVEARNREPFHSVVARPWLGPGAPSNRGNHPGGRGSPPLT